MKKDPGAHKNFFWPSYVDLMTSLFIVMLVLFVLSFLLYNKKMKELEIQKENAVKIAANAKKVEEIVNSVNALPKEIFEYQPDYKRHRLKIDVEFAVGESSIPEQYKDTLTIAGKAIENLINQMIDKYKDTIKYLIIIEGQASIDGDLFHNYELSYKRALALLYHWKSNQIKFDPSVCELMISGSGIEGVGRDMIDDKKNRRFLIQIIPKVGNINDTTSVKK